LMYIWKAMARGKSHHKNANIPMALKSREIKRINNKGNKSKFNNLDNRNIPKGKFPSSNEQPSSSQNSYNPH